MFITVVGTGVPTQVTPLAVQGLKQLGWTAPPEGTYKPGCSRQDCVCQTPPRVCAEYLEDYRDKNCVRCGWTADAHAEKAS